MPKQTICWCRSRPFANTRTACTAYQPACSSIMSFYSVVVKYLFLFCSLFDKITYKSIIFAYFYVAISIIGIFFNDGSTLANAISNLMLILMLVYAYIGARTVLRIGRLMNRRGLLIAAIILSVLFLNLIAIEIYSFAGVFFTISNKKITTK